MKSFGKDPRYPQILFLSVLLFFGEFCLDFGVTWEDVAALCLTSFIAQSFLILALRLPRDSYLSATISALSLLILCRSNHWSGLVGAAFLAISSKFIRWKRKHFFNPTNFGIVCLILISDKVWVSPAQWGSEFFLAFLILALGLTVVIFSRRMDTPLAFLISYSFLLYFRVWNLGQAMPVFFHQLQSGGLLIFTLFMISDPRSTPDHPLGRWIFAISVASVAYWIRFSLHEPNALLLALFFLSPLTVILDSVWKHSRFQWRTHAPHQRPQRHSSLSVLSS